MKRKLLAFLLLGLFAITGAMAQNKIINGKVTGADDGLPLPGVTVKIKGTNVASQTNVDGDYSIPVTGNTSILVFSYIGYVETEIIAGANSTINLTLKVDSKQLSEVVIVGYGTSTKQSFTGSAAVISSDALENRPVTSFEKALQGAASGVTV